MVKREGQGGQGNFHHLSGELRAMSPELGTPLIVWAVQETWRLITSIQPRWYSVVEVPQSEVEDFGFDVFVAGGVDCLSQFLHQAGR